jgi:hypothetical protein
MCHIPLRRDQINICSILVYIYDLPKSIEHKALHILSADDTSMLQALTIFKCRVTLIVFEQLNKWFKSNLLLLNFDKTYFIQFTNKGKCTSDIKIKYEDKQLSIAKETKFLGLFINNNLFWKTQVECIKSKLSSACYAMRSVKPYVTIHTLKMIYYSYFLSVMTYGLLFWGKSPDSIKSFRLQKIIRILMGCSRDSCRILFFKLEIVPFPSQYIFFLLFIRNKNQFLVNSEMSH